MKVWRLGKKLYEARHHFLQFSGSVKSDNEFYYKLFFENCVFEYSI